MSFYRTIRYYLIFSYLKLMFSCSKYISVRVQSVSSVDIKAKEVGEEDKSP